MGLFHADIADLMVKHSYPMKSIIKVYKLVKFHEMGGDHDINLVRDADIISYFNNNLTSYFERKGTEFTKEKILFMWERASPQVKKFILSLKYPPRLKKLVLFTVH